MKTKRIWCFTLAICSIFIALATKAQDYRIVYPESYGNAVAFFNNAPWITDTLARYGINPCVAKAVVFPEIMRYSALKDAIEVRALKVLYIQYGKEYANFSVGQFQMKPSFAEELELAWNQLVDTSNSPLPFGKFDTAPSATARLERVKRLESVSGQLKYLAAFIKVMQVRFNADTASSTWFLAAAYNVGFQKSEQEIRKQGSMPYFHTGTLKPSQCHCYAHIALQYFTEQSENR